jgi:hypothetical protein
LRISRNAALPLLLAASIASGAEPPGGRTTSGILIDRTAPVALLQQLDGSAAVTPASLARWRQVVFELRKSAAVDLGWPASRALARVLRQATDRRTVPLGVVHAHYDRLETPTRVAEAEVFAFAPLRPRLYEGADAAFVLEPAAMLTHRVGTAREWWFDAGDGRGLRRLEPGRPVPVAYAETGTRPLLLEARFADGRVLQAHSSVEVIALATPDPTDTWAVAASEPWGGSAGTGQAYVYLADGHASLINPFVVVEGFDIDNTTGWPELYEQLNQQNLLEDLRAAGYDAVVLDFTEAVDAIQRNAFVLTELLQMVNSVTPPGQSLALIAASMGGLVSRYALLWMEAEALPHHVRTWIAFDAPHDGANMPLGLQAWMRFFSSESEEAEFLLERLRSPAARQMLLYHVDSTVGTSAHPDPQQAALAADFADLGGWPQQTRRVAAINGSGTMTGQGFAAGDQLLEWEYSSFAVDIVGNVWAVPDGGSQMIFEGLIDPLIGSTSSETLTVSGTLPWDNAPGGYRSSMDGVADVSAPYGDIVALHGAHDFIPSVSALALGGVDPFYDIAGDPDLLQATPFDQVYFPPANEEHVAITPVNKAWFQAEIQSGIAVSAISGDSSEAGGTATFTVTAAYPPAAPVTLPLASSDPGEGTVPASVVLPAASTAPQEVTVTGVDDGLADGPQAFTILTGPASSADPVYDGLDPADVAVVNVDDELDLIFQDGFEGPP